MLRSVFVMMLLVCSYASFSQVKSKNIYRFTLDLVNVVDHKIKVELITPVISKKTITYNIPKIVPGTYSDDDYGRFIENFTATDNKGNNLPVTRANVNSWTISGADKLYKISYLVNDVFDDTSNTQIIFEPAGSNIEKDSNYILNNHCFFGYFDEMKKLPYEINVKHPKQLYGSTALTDIDKSNVSDRFITESYNWLVDNPIMYNEPDTTVIRLGHTEVLVSVYSPNKKLSSAFLAAQLDPLLKAQTKYLGGKLPVDKYAYIIYLSPRRGRRGSIGALEHSFSSLFFFLENSPEQLSTFFLSASAHEFFHIITPLNIHSEEIENFDFNNPQMSKHLWLYEGSTEYHAHMVQEKYGLITEEELLKRLGSKISSMKNTYNDTVPFTTLSKEILTKYQNQFRNVYEKGALINLCLDIKLLQLTKGKHGLMKLINDLSLRYGKQKGFKDEELFDEIEKLTFPEIKQFLEKYVAAANPLPLKEILGIVGINYIPYQETKDSIFSNGGASFRFNQSVGRLRITDLKGMNSLGWKLGYQLNDEVLTVNGDSINASNALNFIRNFGVNAKAGDSLVIRVLRKDAAGNMVPVDLKATMTRFPIVRLNVLEFMPNPTPEQLMLRKAWLKPNDMQKQ